MNSKSLALFSAMAALGGLPDFSRAKSEPKEKMPLNEDEVLKLASISGKDRKKYIKELKNKYQK